MDDADTIAPALMLLLDGQHHHYHPFTNESAEDAPTLTVGAAIKTAVLSFMAVASLVGNSATLINITRRRRGTRSSMYTLLLQLAVADLLVSIWCLSGEAAWTYMVEWKGGQVLCKTFKFSQVFSLYLSTSTMVLIGFDRLRAIRRPINHRSCFWPIGIAWLVSALLASPQLAVFRVVEGPFRQPFHQCVTYGFYTEEWQEQLYSIFSLLTMFVVPLISLVSCYACIFYTITKEEKERALLMRPPPRPPVLMAEDRWTPVEAAALRYGRHHKYPAGTNGNPCLDQRREDIFQRAKMKSLRISIIIVSAFVICWAPYYFMMITFIFLRPDDKLGENMQSAIFFFGMSNSLVNPLIYGAFHLCRCLGNKRQQRNNTNRPVALGSLSAALKNSQTTRNKGLMVRRWRRKHRRQKKKTSGLNVDLHLPPPPPIELSASYSQHCSSSANSDPNHPRNCSFHQRRYKPAAGFYTTTGF